MEGSEHAGHLRDAVVFRVTSCTWLTSHNVVDAYSIEQLRFEWMTENALEINPQLELSQFSLIDSQRHQMTKNYTTGMNGRQAQSGC